MTVISSCLEMFDLFLSTNETLISKQNYFYNYFVYTINNKLKEGENYDKSI